MKRGSFILLVLAAGVLWAVQKEPAVVDKIESASGGTATVDWTHGVIEVVGMAPPQERVNVPAARLKAMQRRVAYADAVRLLGESIKGVNVTSETKVADFQLVSDTIELKMKQFIQGQQIVDEKLQEDGTYCVTLRAPLYGQTGSVAAVVLPAVQEHQQAAEEHRQQEVVATGNKPEPPVDVPAKPPAPPTPTPERQPGPYTGVVVDARGFDLQRAMSPKIMKANGAEVWGTVQVDREFVLKTGIVGYAPDLERITRGGDNPLIIRAIGRHGSFRANPVIGDEDAALLLAENQKTKFLDQFKVVFVIGDLTTAGEKP